MFGNAPSCLRSIDDTQAVSDNLACRDLVEKSEDGGESIEQSSGHVQWFLRKRKEYVRASALSSIEIQGRRMVVEEDGWTRICRRQTTRTELISIG